MNTAAASRGEPIPALNDIAVVWDESYTVTGVSTSGRRVTISNSSTNWLVTRSWDGSYHVSGFTKTARVRFAKA